MSGRIDWRHTAPTTLQPRPSQAQGRATLRKPKVDGLCSLCAHHAILLAALILAASGCAPSESVAKVDSSRSSREEAPAPKAVIVGDAVFDFGILEPTDKCEHAFTIRNDGDAPLTLTKAGTSCKCTTSEIPEEGILPGASAEIRLSSKLEQEKEGYFSHSASILTNDPKRQAINLRLTGIVKAYLAAEPAVVHLETERRGEGASRQTLVYSQVWDAFELENVAPSSDAFHCEILPANAAALEKVNAKSGHVIEVAVAGEDMKPGLSGELFLRARPRAPSAEPRELRLGITASVPARMSLYGPKFDGVASRLNFGVLRCGEAARGYVIMVIRDDHPEIEIERIETNPDYLNVTVATPTPEAAKKGVYRIDVEIPADAPQGSYQGPMAGEIKIHTDHPKLPVIEIEADFAVVAEQ